MFLTAFSQARIKAGFSCFPWDMSLDIKETITGHHSWRHNLKLLKALGITVTREDYVGLLPALQGRNLNEVTGVKDFDFSVPYMVIAPGTSAQRTVKAWPESRFAELIRRLTDKYSLNVILVGGTENRAGNEIIISQSRAKTKLLNLAGSTGLNTLCHVLKQARIFVGVDAGIMHLASALDIPVVAIFGPTDPFYVGPLNQRSVVVQKKELNCVPCYLKGCKERSCLEQLGVDAVARACEQLLNS